MHKLIIIAGGPGAGKTTLVEALHARGFATAPEAGRAIIQDQRAIDGPGLPWKDATLFAELLLQWDLRSYRWARTQPGPVFFDHALPGLPSLYRMSGLPVPAHVVHAAERFRYRPTVFIAPPWTEIYRTDAERHQTLAESRRTWRAVCETYVDYGYDLVELPKVDVEARVRFVLDAVTG